MNEIDDPTSEPLSSWARYKLHLAAHSQPETPGPAPAQAASDSSHAVAATALGHCRCQCDEHDEDARDDPRIAGRPAGRV